ncbi:hypothetical protein I8748_23440 [Nostoc sp. CENA67]|uniref:Uncharacterized protein n=1 Tax=Amazonocrinis nigriterrae CENA67 TaxID=2794033 RepID=A0A8J7LCV1_9NOST|nr:hypothetical protein [Amazonocrinis nigriterrae]MBH8565101.1 hypothetical protein [Amazonocrinis nigriterrae CENA67]
MFAITVDDITLTPDDIDYAQAEDEDDNVVSDFVNAEWYRIFLTDIGFDKHSTWEVVASREELDSSSLEYLLEVIQST